MDSVLKMPTVQEGDKTWTSWKYKWQTVRKHKDVQISHSQEKLLGGGDKEEEEGLGAEPTKLGTVNT